MGLFSVDTFAQKGQGRGEPNVATPRQTKCHLLSPNNPIRSPSSTISQMKRQKKAREAIFDGDEM